MKFNGREVVMVRRAVIGDPYYDPQFDKYIVEYADGTGRETVKRAQLEDFVAPPEDKLANKADESVKVMTQREALEDNLKNRQLSEKEKSEARDRNKKDRK